MCVGYLKYGASIPWQLACIHVAQIMCTLRTSWDRSGGGYVQRINLWTLEMIGNKSDPYSLSSNTMFLKYPPMQMFEWWFCLICIDFVYCMGNIRHRETTIIIIQPHEASKKIDKLELMGVVIMLFLVLVAVLNYCCAKRYFLNYFGEGS